MTTTLPSPAFGHALADKPLYEGSDWNFDTIQRIYDTIEKVADDELALDTYPNQIEVITTEQMLDAYSSTGMPLLYNHWSFGKQFLMNEMMYRKGMRGLAYELVINSINKDQIVGYLSTPRETATR